VAIDVGQGRAGGQRHDDRVTGNKFMRLLIMRTVNVRLVSVRRAGVSALL
jgi:hypothetical protein